MKTGTWTDQHGRPWPYIISDLLLIGVLLGMRALLRIPYSKYVRLYCFIGRGYRSKLWP